MRENVFSGAALPDGMKIAVDIDLSKLDRHVSPSMEALVWRGIWFPKGYLDHKAAHRKKHCAELDTAPHFFLCSGSCLRNYGARNNRIPATINAPPTA